MAPKLSSNSKAVKTLVSLFRTGEIKEKDTPSDIQKRYDIFKPHSADAFKKAFHRYKGAVEAEMQGKLPFPLSSCANGKCMN